MKKTKSVLIVEPSCIIVEGLMKILNESQSFETLCPLYDIDLLENRLASAKPDLLLINPTLQQATSRYTLKQIMQDYPLLTLVALVYQYVDSSVMRFFHGHLDIREERKRIEDLLKESLQSTSVNVSSEDNCYELSKRETDVLILIAKGLMNKEIADRLNISVHTVISHRKNISRKTDIHSSAGLAVYAMMNNLIDNN